MVYSYEEIRKAVIDILAGREKVSYVSTQYGNLQREVAGVLEIRETGKCSPNQVMSYEERDIFLEVFWDLFRQGIITLGSNDTNREFPFFRVSAHGKKNP